MENKKLTKLEKYWIMYDVGNSAFVMLIATIIPIYFNYLAKSAGISEVNYLAYWGYAASVSTVIVAVIDWSLDPLQICRITKSHYLPSA